MSAVRPVVPRLSQPSMARASVPVSGARAAVSKAVDGFERKSVNVPPVMQRGSTGAGVRALQERLVKAGFLKAADLATGPGVYGPRTEAAVRKLQQAVGLPVTGVAGPSTHAALSSGTRFQQPAVSRSIHDVPTNPMAAAAVHTRLSAAETTFTDDETTPVGAPLPEVD